MQIQEGWLLEDRSMEKAVMKKIFNSILVQTCNGRQNTENCSQQHANLGASAKIWEQEGQ